MPTQSSHDPSEFTPRKLFNKVRKLSWFKHLLDETKTLRVLQTLFDRECPLEVMGRCQVLGIKEACLTIATDNASSATQLQYRTRELLPALRKYPEFTGVKRISVRVGR
jgi:hypothetical protein